MTNKMKYRNLLSVVYSKLLLLFGVKHNTSVIPKGEYCYTYTTKASRLVVSYIMTDCPYYKPISKKWNGCKYLGIITDDFIFEDKCKICNENLD